MRSWGRLLRLSLAPTAAADVLAGLLLAGAGRLPSAALVGLLLGASLCVYHANMALNDWRDRHGDAPSRPDRPLVSGAIRPSAALAASLSLAALGVALAALAAPRVGLLMAAVFALAAFYNLRGRGPWVGPALLGTCRAGNLAGGLVLLGPAELPASLWTAPLLYGAYVFVVSRLGRLEDREDCDPSGRRPRRHLLSAALALLAVAALPLPTATILSRLGALALASLGAAGLVGRVREVREWTPAAVGASMGLALRRLLVFTAATAALTGTATGWICAGLILLGFPISYLLRDIFPPS